jgi:hypothetical protein
LFILFIRMILFFILLHNSFCKDKTNMKCVKKKSGQKEIRSLIKCFYLRLLRNN